MNLALVVHDFDPKVGHGRYCHELARRLAPSHTVTIYANRFDVEPQPGWKYVRVPAVRTVALASVFTFLAMAERLVRRGRHDIVHAQGLTCWRADVITAHICNAARYRISPPDTLRARVFPTLVNPVERRFYRQRHARQLIAISSRVGDEIRDCYGWRRPVTVIHHGVDTARFRPPADAAEREACRKHFRLPSADWIWLFVGEAIKGLPEGIAQLPAFPKARLLAITRSEREAYETQARALGVADRLHFWGPEPDVARAYRAADLFLYPSSYDTFGMVVLEAMATGLPVIAGRDIGAAELIVPNESGLLIDPAQETEIRAALRTLADEPDLSARLGATARATSLTQTWDACAQATEAVYRRALGSDANREIGATAAPREPIRP